MTDKICIGNTQQNFKKRMAGHFQDVKKLKEKGVHLDSYARHFSGIWPRGAAAPSSGMHWDLWQGNPIWVVKTFGKSIFTLCNREQMEIVILSITIPYQLINSCSESHGACRQKPRFHRYHEQKESPSADERKKHEKVVLEGPNPLRRRE
jgi:hypothetical protein